MQFMNLLMVVAFKITGLRTMKRRFNETKGQERENQPQRDYKS
jgi:hypothetical protein